MKRLSVLATVILLIILWDCSTTTVVRKYYLLNTPGVQPDSSQNFQSLTTKYCEILPVEVANPFSTQRIAIRTSPNGITYYVYNSWAEPPGMALKRILENNIRHSGIFQGTNADFTRINPEYQIKAYVGFLEVVQEGETGYAHLQMDMRFLDTREQKVIFTHSFNRKLRLKKLNLDIFAENLDLILHEEINQFIREIKIHISDRPR